MLRKEEINLQKIWEDLSRTDNEIVLGKLSRGELTASGNCPVGNCPEKLSSENCPVTKIYIVLLIIKHSSLKNIIVF